MHTNEELEQLLQMTLADKITTDKGKDSSL